MHPPDPHRFPLVNTPHVQVEACGCGHVHLTLGVITLRFEIAAFQQLVGALHQAAHRLNAVQRTPMLSPKLDA